MKRIAIAAVVVVVLGALGFLEYRGYRRIRATESKVAELTLQVDEATKLALQEAAAANAASARATDAAAQAAQAAGQRQTAEQLRQQADEQRQQAEASRAQAEAAAQKADQQAAQARTELAQIRQQREQELDQMQAALSKVVETRRTPNGMVMILPDSRFRFAFDSSELNQHNRELLSRIAGILLASKGYGLAVYGYTDDIGTDEYNQKLSLRRAKAVQNYLVQAGIDSTIVNAKGFGKTNPLVPGTSPEARAKNRRVEIALIDSEIKYGAEVPPTAP